MERVGGAIQPTRGEALEHGSSYQREATHISTVSPTLDLVGVLRERGEESINFVSSMCMSISQVNTPIDGIFQLW